MVETKYNMTRINDEVFLQIPFKEFVKTTFDNDLQMLREFKNCKPGTIINFLSSIHFKIVSEFAKELADEYLKDNPL